MVSTGNGKSANEIEEELVPGAISKSDEVQNGFSLYVSTSHGELLDEKHHGNKFRDTANSLPRFIKLGSSGRLPSTSSKFWRIADERQLISSPDNQVPKKLSFVPLIKKISWASLWEMSKRWIRDPLNMALLVWIVCVAVSGAILFLVMTGMLNAALPEKSQRDTWFEVNNQILNALFTLMVLYHHPKRFHHLVLLCRWRSEDILRLRKIYCKNGTEKPNERKHMMVVLVLLHVNCFAQYALCGLNIGYPRSTRPAIGVGLCISVAMAAPAVASVYNIVSPLGKEYDTEVDQEAQSQVASDLNTLEKKYHFMSRDDPRAPESEPQWVGGLFDFWDDISLAYLSVFCSCCVFGWNMERLGFGNMYVHITTFLLFCLAPLFVFNLAAINIDNETVREALSISGFVLCIFGSLYGGFWRIQMRKRFNLPGNSFCCGKPAVTDCFQWLCCCWCSLAQEVRTADYYDVLDDKLYMKQMGGDDSHRVLSPLPREDGSVNVAGPKYPYWGDSSSSYFKMQHSPSPGRVLGGRTSEKQFPVGEGSSVDGTDDTMRPPIAPVIQRQNYG